MSFEAWARGLSTRPHPFAFARQEFADEDDIFDAADVIEDAAELGGIGLRGRSDGFDQLCNMYGTLASALILHQQLALLAAEGRNPESLMASSSGSWWGLGSMPWSKDKRYAITQQDSWLTLEEFLETMIDCNLDRWGFIRAIAMIVSRYVDHCGQHGYRDPSLLWINLEL
jgi:hypothetical protein